MAKNSTPKAVKQAAQAQAAGVKLNGDPLPQTTIALVKLMSPYAFYDDDGVMCSWATGQEVTDVEDIAVLVERSAPVECYGADGVLIDIDAAAAAAEAEAKLAAQAQAEAEAAEAEAQAKAKADADAAAAAAAAKADQAKTTE
jgi:hypothetical protein